ncbi:zinc finger MYM-type protein 1-like [Diprion similis]|uniref:zinc finger MYM-type protein 1-like n=1 Tax=Diprion similis TaxID=362088 RepID=UPI001EF8B20A|nr:zinc finger MYM-type protein 1-like [Diprion similis]
MERKKKSGCNSSRGETDVPSSSTSSESNPITGTIVPGNSSTTNGDADEQPIRKLRKLDINPANFERPEQSESTNQICKRILSDPVTWVSVTDPTMRQLILEKGVEQITDYDFPVENGRRFNPNYYTRTLNNGEKTTRPWLIYSKDTNKIYCLCCLLFSKMILTQWPTMGSCNWKHLSRDLVAHEKSARHITAFKDWKEFDHRLKVGTAIDAHHQRIINQEAAHWQNVLHRIASIIQYLAGQSLALRGSSDRSYDRDNGNFLKLIELFSKFDPVMANHLARIRNEESRYHYLSNTIQNEIILLISSKIREILIKKIQCAKYYSIILHCTPDKSHIEQISIIVRIVEYDDEVKKFEIREHFLGFILVTDTTGKGLTERIISELESLSIPISDMRGQGYDNGANMRGKHSGVQRRILDINPRAFFVQCSAHTLNLVVCDAASATEEITGFFNVIQKVYVFFSSSPGRWDVLKNHTSSLTLKAVSDTRWESRIDAIKPLRNNVAEIYDALLEISMDTDRAVQVQHEAKCLAQSLQNFKFICSLIIWYNVLDKINTASKMMQDPSLNIFDCCQMLQKTIETFKQYRTEESFSVVLQEATKLAADLEIEPLFPAENTVRVRRKKRLFDYETTDEPITDPKQKFKTEFFFHILDTTVTSMQERFQPLEAHGNKFIFIYNIHELKSLSKDQGENMDVDGIDLCDELINLAAILPSKLTPIGVLNFIARTELQTIFPNVIVALRIWLTLPVSVASGERTFSKLKLRPLARLIVVNMKLLTVQDKKPMKYIFQDGKGSSQ